MGEKNRYRALDQISKLWERVNKQPFVWAQVKDIVPAPRILAQFADKGYVRKLGRVGQAFVWTVTKSGKEVAEEFMYKN